MNRFTVSRDDGMAPYYKCDRNANVEIEIPGGKSITFHFSAAGCGSLIALMTKSGMRFELAHSGSEHWLGGWKHGYFSVTIEAPMLEEDLRVENISVDKTFLYAEVLGEKVQLNNGYSLSPNKPGYSYFFCEEFSFIGPAAKRVLRKLVQQRWERVKSFVGE